MKKILMIFTVVSAAAVVAVLFSILGTGRQFIIKDKSIVAAEADLYKIFSAADSEEVFDFKVEEMTEYFTSNGINTVIIPYNDGKNAVAAEEGFSNTFGENGYYRDNDILLALKKPFEEAGIQIILEIDCEQLTEAEITELITEGINKKYRFAGVVLTGWQHSNEALQNIRLAIKRRMHNYWFGLYTNDMENAKLLQSYGAVDFYVFEDINSTQYKELKNGDFASAQILLTHRLQNFAEELFILSNFYSIDGVILTEYTTPDTDLGFYLNMMDTSGGLTRFNMFVDSSFYVSYPSKDISTYYDGIFVTGVANPYEPVYVNGQPATQGKDGSFGLYINLEEGDNLLEIEQGDSYARFTVTRKVWESTGYTPKAEYDDTVRAYKGQVVQTINPLTSILSNPDKDEAIMDGVQQGVQMVVEKSVRTTRDGVYTWAYVLSNGGYVLADKVEWVDDAEYTNAEFNDIYLENTEDGNEYLTISITGKPAVVSSFKGGTVEFTFLNTVLGEKYTDQEEDTEENDDGLILSDISSRFTTLCSVKQDGENTVLVLENNTENELWGYNTEYYEDETVKIYLKKAPKKQQGAEPLTGVSIMLDAGHGGKDPGALAMSGIAGPNENDINLAVTLATKQCLEKMGATVYLTRSDDTYLTLEERRSMITQLKPDLFISQHHNSLDNTVDINRHSGVESYYFTSNSATMAEIMAERISASTNRKNRGYGFGYFYVLRTDIAPSVLNEYGFIVNPQEYSNIYRDEEIYKAAFATAQAVLDIIPE